MVDENRLDLDHILSEWKVRYEDPIDEALSKELDPLFQNPNGETWAAVQKLLARETQSAVSKLLDDISGLALDSETSDRMVQNLRDYGRNVVGRKARDEADIQKVKLRMKIRYGSILTDALVRRKEKKETPEVACTECLKLLSVVVAICLDQRHDQEILNKLIYYLLRRKWWSENTLDHKSIWSKVSPENTLITPAECKLLWEQFQVEILPQTQAFFEGMAAARQARASYLSLFGCFCGLCEDS